MFVCIKFSTERLESKEKKEHLFFNYLGNNVLAFLVQDLF